MNRTRLKLISLVVGAGWACNASPSGQTATQSSAQTVADAGTTTPAPTIAQVVTRTDIVSDLPGAAVQDQTLLNAWGLSFNPQGVAWVSANGSGTANVYSATGSQVIPPVTIPVPPGAQPPSAPTGQVFNASATSFRGDKFIFVTEDGTVSGWQPVDGSAAVLRVDNSAKDAIYKGVAIATSGTRTRLFATDFHNGRIDVFDDNYAPVQATGGFTDPNMPSGFAPFNVVESSGALIVTYAQQDADRHDDVHGVGLGFVDLFDFDGHLIVRLISQGPLNAPWGIALSSTNFGSIPFRMYVGNFGDGMINVYRLQNVNGLAQLVHDGVVGDSSGKPLVIDGLWALAFGPDAGGFSSTSLYFTAGPNDEADGVFGRLNLAGQ
jgi:uncharacterized protein (TIGR03118 family)